MADAPTEGTFRDRPPPSVDPTLLTTEQLLREIANLKAIFDGQLDTLRERLNGMDRATELTGLSLRTMAGDLDDKRHGLEMVIDEKFATVDQKFDDLAARTAEQKADTKAAVDAALQAAKEAVGQQTEASERSIAKSEAATTKQIDGVIQLLSTSGAATGESISDLKSRMDRMEAARLNSVENGTVDRQTRSVGFQGVGVFIAAFASLIAVASLIALALKP
jgi:hypothetical protein